MTAERGAAPAGRWRPRALAAPWMIGLVWLPIVAISFLHYATDPELTWAHDVLRRLYYLPILFAAFRLGLPGGLLAAVAVSLAYLPHAFLHGLAHIHHDPARGLEKILEILLYHVVGVVAGYLAGLERRRRAELQQAFEELRRAFEEQKRLRDQLVRAGRLSALGQLVAGIAHEVKNPLHSLAGTAEIIGPLIPGDAEERRMWEIHVAEIARLQRVAERFLSFARPSPPSMAALDLRDVARRLEALVAAEARQRGVTIGLDLPDAGIIVNGDRDQLAQIGLNIAVNGFSAIGKGGGRMRISVGSGEPSGAAMVFLRIENDGPALPDDELEAIFDPFHTTEESGTGLGLSISSRIAEQHDGYLTAENGGLGVAFTLWLPAHAGEAGTSDRRTDVGAPGEHEEE